MRQVSLPTELWNPSAYALKQLPAPNDFLVLPENHSVSAVTPIKLIHANVMPLYTDWSATDKNNRFILTTVDLNAQVLKLVARGKSLRPRSTNATLNNISTTPEITLEQTPQLT